MRLLAALALLVCSKALVTPLADDDEHSIKKVPSEPDGLLSAAGLGVTPVGVDKWKGFARHRDRIRRRRTRSDRRCSTVVGSGRSRVGFLDQASFVDGPRRT